MGDVEATNADLFLGKLEEERRRRIVFTLIS